MNILYQKNNCLLRLASPKDGTRLAKELRWEDRAELSASHPGREASELVSDFINRSVHCFILEHQSVPAALFGLAPDVWLGRRACVWLLTGKRVLRIPKTFLRVSRALLMGALAQYDELYNFTDERYAAALRLIRHLGGRFDGRSFDTPAARFLRFTFRR